MYTHRVIIMRNTLEDEFFYMAKNILEDPDYINMSTIAKNNGKMISDEINITSDGLVLERTVTWDSVESFDEFLNQWLTIKPNYKIEMEQYNTEHNHTAVLIR